MSFLTKSTFLLRLFEPPSGSLANHTNYAKMYLTMGLNFKLDVGTFRL